MQSENWGDVESVEQNASFEVELEPDVQNQEYFGEPVVKEFEEPQLQFSTQLTRTGRVRKRPKKHLQDYVV